MITFPSKRHEIQSNIKASLTLLILELMRYCFSDKEQSGLMLRQYHGELGNTDAKIKLTSKINTPILLNVRRKAE